MHKFALRIADLPINGQFVLRPVISAMLVISLAACGSGAKESEKAPNVIDGSSFVLRGTVPGTLIEAFCEGGLYRSAHSTRNGTDKHPFAIALPADVACRVMMTVNENDPQRSVVVPIEFVDANSVSGYSVSGKAGEVDLGDVSLPTERGSMLTDSNADGVEDRPMRVSIDSAAFGRTAVSTRDDELDDDGDGIVDRYEDSDADGLYDAIDDDDDNDGIPDDLDTDRDGDGHADNDHDHDGVPNGHDRDDDNDGENDEDDQDDDNDGIDDNDDDDDDNDGIADDVDEDKQNDLDGDGLDNDADDDDDNDGKIDEEDEDDDNDGIRDEDDDDDDNDGIVDVQEIDNETDSAALAGAPSSPTIPQLGASVSTTTETAREPEAAPEAETTPTSEPEPEPAPEPEPQA